MIAAHKTYISVGIWILTVLIQQFLRIIGKTCEFRVARMDQGLLSDREAYISGCSLGFRFLLIGVNYVCVLQEFLSVRSSRQRNGFLCSASSSFRFSFATM